MITNTQTTNKPFIVMRDGELDNDLSWFEPKVTLTDRLQRVKQTINLQTEMALYDIAHGTHYRSIRNQLMRQKRNREFEVRIGLIKEDAKKR